MEYVDGELVERHVGEHKHSRLQTLTVGLLLPLERERGFRVLTEQRFRILGTKHLYRIPDVCVMGLPYRSEPVLTTPPHLIIEILSPDDETAETLARVADFLRFGVAHIWIANPYKHTLQEADREGIQVLPRPGGGNRSGVPRRFQRPVREGGRAHRVTRLTACRTRSPVPRFVGERLSARPGAPRRVGTPKCRIGFKTSR
jgi:hypothetical protein